MQLSHVFIAFLAREVRFPHGFIAFLLFVFLGVLRWPPRAILSDFGCPLGASWDPLGASLGAFWASSGALGDPLGPLGGHQVALWVQFLMRWMYLGSVFFAF